MPFLIRETEIAATRKKKLDVVGPEGHEHRVTAAMDLLFPGGGRNTGFRVNYEQYVSGKDLQIGSVRVRATPVQHTVGTNPHAVRLEVDDKVVVYSGDTGMGGWTRGVVCRCGPVHLRVLSRRSRGSQSHGSADIESQPLATFM